MRTDQIHIGSLIRAELAQQHRTVTWLAQQLNIQRPNCYRILNAQSIHTDQLVRVSIAMQHDFFADCSECIQLASKN